MAKSINEVHLKGRVGRDAEIKHTSTGKVISKFSLATGGGKKKDGGEWPTEWHNIESWNESATAICKGQVVELWGRIKTESWDDRQTGMKKYMTKVVADKFEIESPHEDRSGGFDQSVVDSSFDEDSIPF